MRNRFDEYDPAEIFYFGLKVSLAAGVVWFASHLLSTRLPTPFSLDAEINKEPEQMAISNPLNFQKEIGSQVYAIEPKADYKLRGLVVETHDSSSWLDITHAQAGDIFNTHDICVIWGENARSQYLSDIRFSHGDWTCYFQTNNADAWKNFRKDQISNNHILPATAEVLDLIRSVQIGDQIEISGQLVDYSTDGNPVRKTSLIRTDVENGACEIIYATNARFLSRPPALWRLLERLAWFSIGAGTLVMLFAIAVLPYLQSRKLD